MMIARLQIVKKKENIDENAPKTPYDGKNMNDSSGDERNNDEDDPEPPTNNVNINANSDDEKNDYEVTPDTSTNGGNNETIYNDKDKIMIKKLRRKNIIKPEYEI